MPVETKKRVTYHDLVTGLRGLGIESGCPVIAHASLSSFGEVRGGPEVLLGALQATMSTLVMPTFTDRPEIIPEVGPEDNAIQYGSGGSSNLMAEFFTPKMPADKMMGVVPEALRHLPGAARSSHPLLSFAGLNAVAALSAQTVDEPLAPIRILAEQGGWVLLLGVGHTANTSIHYAEKVAGRRQFTRWALTSEGVIVCPGYPGCSDGFQAVAATLEPGIRKTHIGQSLVQAVSLEYLIAAVTELLEENPHALLCDRVDCPRCNAVRRDGRMHH